MKNIIGLILSLQVITSCIQPPQEEKTPSGWQAVYKHDEDGLRVAGSIDTLIQGIRKGYDVRVGWGWHRTLSDPERIAQIGDSSLSIEHMAEPVFLTIIQEKDVSVVIDAHPLLSSYFTVEGQTFREGGHIWQCVLTTQGTFNAKVFNRATGELMQDWPQTHRMTWFLDYPIHSSGGTVKLYE
ncbi:MAG: hypothetical protein AAF824_07900 [Bacteroidota bacterium]